jgi:hypothetical protein
LADFERIYVDGLGDVFELSLAEVVDLEVEPALDLPIGVLREGDRAGRGHALEPSGDVDSIAHQVPVAFLDNVAEMDADAKFDALVGRDLGVALDHRPLDFNGAIHCVDDAANFDDAAIPGALDDAAVMHRDGRVDEIAALYEPCEDAIFVCPGQATIADDIGHQDRRELPGLAHCAF